MRQADGRTWFSVAADLDASCTITTDAICGEVLHVRRNSSGGSISTPIARFYAWRPGVQNEVYRAHWHVDCFVLDHRLSPDPSVAGTALVQALFREGLCSEPLCVSWHRSKEVGGREFGEVFERD
jgi:hypothetical protein